MIPTIDPYLYRLLLSQSSNNNKYGMCRNQVLKYLTGQVLFYLFYTISILYFSALTLSIEICISKFDVGIRNFDIDYTFRNSKHSVDMNVKLIYAILVVMTILLYLLNESSNDNVKQTVSPLAHYFGKFKKRSHRFLSCISLWYFLLRDWVSYAISLP